MQLFRVHAYAVEPQRTTEGATRPTGGAVNVNADIRKALEQASNQSRLENRTLVDLQVDTTTRTNETRELIIQFSFRSSSEAKVAALRLAARLSKAMDLRSAPCLLVIAAEKEADRRRITMWTFPRDEAFQFRGGSTHPSIKLLTDIFSRTSHLRKAARFEGKNRRTDFLSGRSLDFQANSTSREVADFWIGRFLNAALAIRGDAGTRLLAKCLRDAYDAAQSLTEREQLYAAMVAVRRSPKHRWSLKEFAETYLEGRVKKSFLSTAPNETTVNSSFDFQRDIFDTTLNFRVFHLNTDVWVSAPFNEVGKSVVLSGVRKKRLRCEGVVTEDLVRKRRA